MVFEMTGCEIDSAAAALDMLPDCATASRIWRSRSLTRRPIRSAHCMALPCSLIATSISINRNRLLHQLAPLLQSAERSERGKEAIMSRYLSRRALLAGGFA